MPYPYNVSIVNATNSTLGLFQASNELSGGILFPGLVFAIFIVGLGLGTQIQRNNLGKTLIMMGFVCFMLNFILLAGGLIDWYYVILYLVILIIGIIMESPKDRSV